MCYTSSHDLKNILDLTQRKRSQLHQSIDTPFYLTIERYEYKKELNTFIYEIEYGIKIDQFSVSTKTIYKRYSEIFKFYSELSLISKIININEFPGKIWFFKNDENKIKQRYEQMNICLSQICHIKNILNNNVFKEFVNEK